MKNCTVWALGCLVLAGFTMPGAVVAGWFDGKPEFDVEASYLKHCSICHGDKGDADTRALSGMFPKARDFTTKRSAIELTRERMIYSTLEGRPGTAMIAHKGRLPDAEIEALVDYIRTEFMRVSGTGAGGSPSAVSPGEKIYVEFCSVCHGDDGNVSNWAKNGLNPPPRDFTAPGLLSVLTLDRMVDSVANGRSGTGMTPFKRQLSKNDITAVVKFIRFNFMGVDPDRDSGGAPLSMINPAPQRSTGQAQAQRGGIPGVNMPLSASRSSPAAADPYRQAPRHQGMPQQGQQQYQQRGQQQYQQQGQQQYQQQGQQQYQQQGRNMSADMSLPIPNGLRGNARWGRDSYMKNCSACHGEAGAGNGPRAYFINPRPRDFTSNTSRQTLNRPRIFKGINEGVLGTVMPAWSKIMSPQEIANLSEFVFQTFIQSPPQMGKKKIR